MLYAKFTNEIYFCFRLAIVSSEDGAEEGAWLLLFEHSSKKVIIHEKYIELVSKEIKRTKNLQRNTALWFASSRLLKSMCLSDPTVAVKGAAKKKAKKLAAIGICIIADIINTLTTPDNSIEKP